MLRPMNRLWSSIELECWPCRAFKASVSPRFSSDDFPIAAWRIDASHWQADLPPIDPSSAPGCNSAFVLGHGLDPECCERMAWTVQQMLCWSLKIQDPGCLVDTSAILMTMYSHSSLRRSSGWLHVAIRASPLLLYIDLP